MSTERMSSNHVNTENDGTVDISGLDKAEVLVALYNYAKPQGMGFFYYNPAPITIEEAREWLIAYKYFDYLKGRVMKVNLATDKIRPWGYDRDNGAGSVQRIVDQLRSSKT